MRHFFSFFTKKDYVFFVVSSILYGVLLQFFVVTCWDTLTDRFLHGAEQFTYVSNFRDLLQSELYYYMHGNGRFLAIMLANFFGSFGGYTLFYIASSVMFFFLQMATIYLIRRTVYFTIWKESGEMVKL